MTPIFETKKDLANERTIIEFAERFCMAKFVKQEKLSHIDFKIYGCPRDNFIGYAEVKMRNNRWGDYDTWNIDLLKWQKLRAKSRMDNVPFILFLGMAKDYPQKGRRFIHYATFYPADRPPVTVKKQSLNKPRCEADKNKDVVCIPQRLFQTL